MLINNILWTSIWALGLWIVIVFSFYMIAVVVIKVKSPSAVARVLYGLYFSSLFAYLILWSPFANIMQPGNLGFVVGLSVFVIILILLIVTGVQKAKKGGG